jgi:hypothetical protein
MSSTTLAKKKWFPWYILLLPLFFVWKIWNDHFALIPFSHWIKALLIFLAISGAAFLIGKLLFKNNIKAGCCALGFQLVFFFWGALHDFVKGLGLPSFLTSYTFFLPFVLVVLALYLVWLKKSRPPLLLNNFLVLLFTLFIAMEVITTIWRFSRKDYLKNDLAYYSEPVHISIGANAEKPDIFFIVFDEYGSTAALKKYLQFDNSNLDSLLVKNNFYVAANSKSNYDLTPVSIASTLNLQYFNYPLEGKSSEPVDLFQYQYSLKKSLLPQFLAMQGYTIINQGIGHLEAAPTKYEPFFDRFTDIVLYGETLWQRFLKDVGWHFPGLKKWSLIKWQGQDEAVAENKEKFASVLKELQTQSAKPKFVYAHFMLPHTPYFVDRNGNKRNLTGLSVAPSEDSLYLDQLRYTNTLIDSLSTAANAHYGRPRVVIMEGDHGARKLYKQHELIVRERQFMNLSSYYFSDRDYRLLYDSISPVNSFRVVLNKYFHSNLPLLKDSTILLFE